MSSFRTIRLAVRVAGLQTADIGLVHAHATSIPLGDLNESRVLLAVLGEGAAVTATKSMTGHLLGASGSLGALVVTMAFRHGLIPPTINVDSVDPEIGVDVVHGSARATEATARLVNSFGFGGHNVSPVLTRG